MSLPHSAIAVLRTPNSFVFEGPVARRDYPDVCLFGGGVEPGEHPDAAIERELWEELGLAGIHPDFVWKGKLKTQNREGARLERFFDIYHVSIDSVDALNLQVPASIVEVPTSDLGHQTLSRLTEVALFGLGRVIAHGHGYPTLRSAA